MKCTLTIAGKMNEVLPIAVYHAVKTHGHKNSAKLRREISAFIKKAK
jgi:predicted small metal-binding protein